jgi:hypothetical protein
MEESCTTTCDWTKSQYRFAVGTSKIIWGSLSRSEGDFKNNLNLKTMTYRFPKFKVKFHKEKYHTILDSWNNDENDFVNKTISLAQVS